MSSGTMVRANTMNNPACSLEIQTSNKKEPAGQFECGSTGKSAARVGLRPLRDEA